MSYIQILSYIISSQLYKNVCRFILWLVAVVVVVAVIVDVVMVVDNGCVFFYFFSVQHIKQLTTNSTFVRTRTTYVHVQHDHVTRDISIYD